LWLNEDEHGMKTRIVQIGDSKWIRIPKSMLEQIGLQGEVEIRAAGETLVICRTRKIRAGWAAAFRKMARRGDDVVDTSLPCLSSWDMDEWEWQ